jgi:hypothetical protein
VRFVLLLLVLPACSNTGSNFNDTNATLAGTVQDGTIREASGLARSNYDDDLLWVINDGGSPPILHAVGTDGSNRGAVRVANAANIDWEDLASYESQGKSWLLVADVGDNLGARKAVNLYLVEEPLFPLADSVSAKRITFVYPNGPRDAEAVAVDVEQQRAIILTKRTIPAEFYAVSLSSIGGETVVAERLGEISNIPQPTASDLERALARKNWHWQPTGIDFFSRWNVSRHPDLPLALPVRAGAWRKLEIRI